MKCAPGEGEGAASGGVADPRAVPQQDENQQRGDHAGGIEDHEEPPGEHRTARGGEREHGAENRTGAEPRYPGADSQEEGAGQPDAGSGGVRCGLRQEPLQIKAPTEDLHDAESDDDHPGQPDEDRTVGGEECADCTRAEPERDQDDEEACEKHRDMPGEPRPHTGRGCEEGRQQQRATWTQQRERTAEESCENTDRHELRRSSSLIAETNTSVGWAPMIGRPLTRKAGVEAAPSWAASSMFACTPAAAASPVRSSLNFSTSRSRSAARVSSPSSERAVASGAEPEANSARLKARYSPCSPAAYAARAARLEASPNREMSRPSIRSSPASTNSSISGSVCTDHSAQNPHWKSENMTNPTGASSAPTARGSSGSRRSTSTRTPSSLASPAGSVSAVAGDWTLVGEESPGSLLLKSTTAIIAAAMIPIVAGAHHRREVERERVMLSGTYRTTMCHSRV